MSFYADFAAVYEQVFPLRPALVDGVAALLGDVPRRVLDVGCGPAHLASALADRGHAPTAVDLDEAMIDEARRRDERLTLRVLDMRDLAELDGPFDAALCLGNVLPHLAADDLPETLAALHGRLDAGAPWVVQTVNFDRFADEDAWRFPDLETREGFVFRRSYEGLRSGRAVFRTRLERDGETLFAGEAPMTPFSFADLEAAHRDAGFTLDSPAADFAGAPYDPAASPGRVLVFRRA